MNKLKKIIPAFALMMLFSTSTAFATTQVYKFDLYPGDVGHTSYYSKDDNEGFAYVRTMAGNLRTSDCLYYRVRNRADTKFTKILRIDNYGKARLTYMQSVSAGEDYRLQAYQMEEAPYPLHIEGRWTP